MQKNTSATFFRVGGTILLSGILGTIKNLISLLVKVSSVYSIKYLHINICNKKNFFVTIASPENGTWLTYECITPNWYFDFKDVPLGIRLDVYCTNDGLVYYNILPDINNNSYLLKKILK